MLKFHFDPLQRISVKNQCSQPLVKIGAAASKTDFCGSCHKHVHNLEHMTRFEVWKMLYQTRGKCCIKIAKKNGKIIFRKSRPARDFMHASASACLALFACISALAFKTNNTQAQTSNQADNEFGSMPTLSPEHVKDQEDLIKQRVIDNSYNISSSSGEFGRLGDREISYGDYSLSEATIALLTYIEGTFGALIMLSSAFASAGALFISHKKRSRKWIAVAVLFGLLAVAAFLLRVSLATFFNTQAL